MWGLCFDVEEQEGEREMGVGRLERSEPDDMGGLWGLQCSGKEEREARIGRFEPEDEGERDGVACQLEIPGDVTC